jgi:tetratricopeptide (TPR) repeat protein
MRTEKYFQVSWWLFKENPLFGTGLWSFRNMVYDAQAEIEKSGGAFFKDYPEPKPRRVHNEYLEVLNDGGLVAALVLAALVWVVMKHGWTVIGSETAPREERVIASTAFCALTGILVAALFFFPFRINTTLFMTALMLGITEGLYLRHSGLLEKSTFPVSARAVFVPVIFLLLTGWIYYAGYKPFKGELEHLHYKKALAQKNIKAAERHILEALRYDPHNSAYCLQAAELYMGPLKNLAGAREYLERAIVDFNGDLTKWSMFYFKGLLAYQTGGLFEAKAAFEKALYYNPLFPEAGRQLEEVNRVLKENDKVLIKLR